MTETTETTSVKIPVRQLRAGDVMALTGEVILNCYADSRTPKGKRTVGLKSDGGKARWNHWNAGTMVLVRR